MLLFNPRCRVFDIVTSFISPEKNIRKNDSDDYFDLYRAFVQELCNLTFSPCLLYFLAVATQLIHWLIVSWKGWNELTISRFFITSSFDMWCLVCLGLESLLFSHLVALWSTFWVVVMLMSFHEYTGLKNIWILFFAELNLTLMISSLFIIETLCKMFIYALYVNFFFVCWIIKDYSWNSLLEALFLVSWCKSSLWLWETTTT